MKLWKEMFFQQQKLKKLNHDSSDPSCVVSGSLVLLLKLSRAVGMSPLSFSRSLTTWLIAPSQPLASLQRLIMTGFNIMILSELVWDFSLEPSQRIHCGESTLTAVVWFGDVLLVMLIASMVIYMGTIRMERLIQTLKHLQQINYGLKINPPSGKSEMTRSVAVVCFLAWSTALQLADIYDLYHEAIIKNKIFTGPIMALSIAFNYANIVEIMAELQWYYIVSATHTATAALNQQLQHLRYANLKLDPKLSQDELNTAPQSITTLVNSFMTQGKTDTGPQMSLSQAQATIRRLALSYDSICDVVSRMNADNGPILFVMILSSSLRLVFSPYYLLMGIFTSDVVVPSRVFLQVNWIAFHIIRLMLIEEPCHWTQQQREHTELVLSQLTVHLGPKCKQVYKELQSFAKQVILNKAKFMPLGICTLSRLLIVTILGSVTTNLIIIIQFQTIGV